MNPTHSSPFPSVERLNENSLLLVFGAQPSVELLATICQYEQQLTHDLNNLIRELIPANTSILLEFDDQRIPYEVFLSRLQRSLKRLNILDQQHSSNPKSSARLHSIPVFYHPSVAPDLEALAAQKGMTVKDVIERHAHPIYTVYAVGFAPGFAYLGSVDEHIATPRHSSPRTLVPAGSVGIAEQQTGIYPRSSPGGWNIIGRTPTPVLQPLDTVIETPSQLCRFAVGDQVRFYPIKQEEYERRLTEQESL